MSTPTWMDQHADGVVIRLRIQPRAKCSGIVGPHGDALKIRLQAPPVDNKANAALLRFLAERLNRPRATVELLSGSTGRDKRVLLRGCTMGAATHALRAD